MRKKAPILMFIRGSGLSVKITGMLLGFFLVALAAIALTLFISWHLEGAAAAINDAGSLRMRVYRLAHHLARADVEKIDRSTFAADLQKRIDDFDAVLSVLRRGDPSRPLFVPREDGIPEDLAEMAENWATRSRPILSAIVADPSAQNLHLRGLEFDAAAEACVDSINDLVLRMEQSYARNTNILRTSQVILVALAVIGTILLLRFFFLTVIRPVFELHEGVKRMGQEDFDARVPVLSQDEFGELSAGFNRMAAHLQNVLRHARGARRRQDAQPGREEPRARDPLRHRRLPARAQRRSTRCARASSSACRRRWARAPARRACSTSSRATCA